MIVREIKDQPDKVLAVFDWFNDYDDTYRWCKRNYPEIVDRLQEGYNKWLKNFNRKLEQSYRND